MNSDQSVFFALADPTRRWIIHRLSQSSSETVSNLASELPVTRQAVSKHFEVLLDAGLVTSSQVGRERFYSLNPDPLAVTTDWIEEIGAQWDHRLQNLKEYLSEDKGEN